MGGGSETRGNPTDYATRTIFDGAHNVFEHDADSSRDANAEIHATLCELIAAFGTAPVEQCLAEIPALAKRAHDEARVREALITLALIALETKHPKFAMLCVGKLVGLEALSGSRMDLDEIGATIGICKQAVSRRVAAYANRLNLPRPDSTEATRTASRLMNKRNYGRKLAAR